MATTEERLEALEDVVACMQLLFGTAKLEAARRDLATRPIPPTPRQQTAEAIKQARRR